MAMASNGSDYHGILKKKNVGLQYVFSFHQAPTFGGGNKYVEFFCVFCPA